MNGRWIGLLLASVATLGFSATALGQSTPPGITGSYADTVRVVATMSAPQDTLLLGEPFDTRVMFRSPEPVAKVVLLTTPENLDPIELVEMERQLDADGLVIERVRLRAFAIGRVGIASMLFAGVTQSNTLVLAETAADTVTIASLVPEDAEGLADIYDPVPIERSRSPWVWVALAVAVLGIGLAAAWWWRRRRRETATPAPLVPAHEAALTELRTLAADPRSRSGPWKPYYTDVTDVLRQYLLRRFGIAAPDLTTSETVRSLRSTEVEDALVDSLRVVLIEADSIKFAKLNPDPADVSRHLESAMEFVRRTPLAPPVAPSTDATEAA